MKKFVFLAAVTALMTVALPAWAATHLWSNHTTRSFLSDGRSVYDAAGFGWLYLDVEDDDTVATEAHLRALGNMTFIGGSYSFWNGTEYEPVSGTIKTFKMISTDMELGDDFLAYRPVNDQGRYISFYNAAETGLNGREVRWEFSDMPELNGKATIPNFLSTAQQMTNAVPYVELTRSGGNVTGLQWRVVKSSNTGQALSMTTRSRVRVRIYNHDENRLYNSGWQNFDANATLEGTATFDTAIPESDLCRVDVSFRPDRATASCYTWQFASRTDNSDAGIASWGDLTDTPLKIEQGKTATVTVTMKDNFHFSAREKKVFVGDESVLSVSTEDSDSATATLSLEGLKHGKTTIRILYYENGKHYSTSTAREVWVTDASGNIPDNSDTGSSNSGGGGCYVLANGLALLLAIPLLRRKRG